MHGGRLNETEAAEPSGVPAYGLQHRVAQSIKFLVTRFE
jgi:hypothetical protein